MVSVRVNEVSASCGSMATDPSVYHARFLARVSLYVGDVCK